MTGYQLFLFTLHQLCLFRAAITWSLRAIFAIPTQPFTVSNLEVFWSNGNGTKSNHLIIFHYGLSTQFLAIAIGILSELNGDWESGWFGLSGSARPVIGRATSEGRASSEGRAMSGAKMPAICTYGK